MITSAHFAADAGSIGAKPACFGGLPAAAAGAHADAHISAAVLQVQRVCVTLRSVSHDRDAAREDRREVNVGIVNHLCHDYLLLLRF